MTLSVIEKDGQENRINWSWRTYFHPLATDIAKGLDARMREITERALLAMKKSLDTTGTLEMMPVSQNLVGGRLDYPKWVAKVGTCMLVFFFFNCMFYQVLGVPHSSSSTTTWGSVLPSIVETRDQDSRGCPLLFSNRNLGSFCA